MEVVLFAVPTPKGPDFRHAISFAYGNFTKESFTALFESLCYKLSSHNNPFQGKIYWTIAPGNSLFYEFAQVGRVGVEDAGTRLLTWKTTFLCELCQGMCRLYDTYQMGYSSQVGTGTGNADIAEGTASRGTDLDDVLLGYLARK
jgi:hypothetical protein